MMMNVMSVFNALSKQLIDSCTTLPFSLFKLPRHVHCVWWPAWGVSEWLLGIKQTSSLVAPAGRSHHIALTTWNFSHPLCLLRTMSNIKCFVDKIEDESLCCVFTWVILNYFCHFIWYIGLIKHHKKNMYKIKIMRIFIVPMYSLRCHIPRRIYWQALFRTNYSCLLLL